MKRLTSTLLILILTIGYAATASAKQIDTIAMAPGISVMDITQKTDTLNRKKVGLVLSGGGAKGVAHISVLRVLEEAGIPIDYIAGTSMGAIMGGLYAIGYTPRELDSMVRTQDWPALLTDRVDRTDMLLSEKEADATYIASVGLSFDSKFSLPSGMYSGQNVLNLFNEMTIGYHGHTDFNELPIPFACVTYDMVRGEEVVFHEGDLPKAIRASMSIPGAFAPVIMDSLVLVDGGIYNNFPVDVVKDMGADIVIAVDLFGGLKDAEGLETIMGIVDQITAILGREKYQQNLKLPDVYMHVDVNPYTSASFSPEAIDSLLVRGERVAYEHWDELIALKEVIGVPVDYKPPTHIHSDRLDDDDSLYIGPINFNGLTRNEEAIIRPSFHVKENSITTKEELNKAIEKLRGSGAFSYVTYSLNSAPPYDLTVSVDEKKEASVNIGFRFDSQEMASILLNTKLVFRGLQGPSLGLTGRLNDNPYIKLDFASSSWFLGRLGISYMFKQNNYKMYSRGSYLSTISFGQNRVDVYYLVANPQKFTINAGVRYEHFNYKPFLYTPDILEGGDIIAVEPKGFFNYYLTTKFETRNHRYYPTKGSAMNTTMVLHTDNGINHLGGAPFGSIGYSFSTAVSFGENTRFTLLPEIHGRTVIGHTYDYSYLNYMGGDIPGRYMDQQLSFVGIRHIETFGRSLLTFSLEARYRFFKRHYVSAKGGYAMHNKDFFDMFTDRNDIWGVGIKYSFDSPVGPISIQFDTSNRDPSLGVYFSLGKIF